MLAPTERSMPATRSTKVMPMAMIAMCAAWVTMLMKLVGVRNRSESEPKTAISTQEQQQRRVLQRQHAQRGWPRGAHAAGPLTPSHMARAQDRLAVERRARRTRRGSRRGP